MNEYNDNNGDALPNFDDFEEPAAPTTRNEEPSEDEDERIFRDRGFFDATKQPFDPRKLKFVSVETLAEWLLTSPGSARRRLRENKVWVYKSGRKILVPEQSAETLVVRSFVQLEEDDEESYND